MKISFIKYAFSNHKLNTSTVPKKDLWALGKKWDTILPLRISWLCVLNYCKFFWDVNNSSFSFWRHSMESTFDFMKINIIGQISEVNPVNIVRIGNEAIHLKEKKFQCQWCLVSYEGLYQNSVRRWKGIQSRWIMPDQYILELSKLKNHQQYPIKKIFWHRKNGI